MMSRVVLLSFLGIWAGTVILLMLHPWFNGTTLIDRLRRYTPGGMAVRGSSMSSSIGGRNARSHRSSSAVERGGTSHAIATIAGVVGSALAKIVGVREDIRVRLARIASTETPSAFRTRQLRNGVGALFAAGLVAAGAQLSGPAAAVVIIAAPVAAILWPEQKLATANDAYQQAILHELPVVAEQLGMLMSAGYSLSAALHRLSRRPTGVCGRDLRAVALRIRQGVSEVDALIEWADLAKVDALSRLVEVLSLNREAGDLGSMISAESRAIRREVHRALLEEIERRSQTVWIPVTVATLVPGVIFLAIPFTAALNQFSGG